MRERNSIYQNLILFQLGSLSCRCFHCACTAGCCLKRWVRWMARIILRLSYKCFKWDVNWAFGDVPVSQSSSTKARTSWTFLCLLPSHRSFLVIFFEVYTQFPANATCLKIDKEESIFCFSFEERRRHEQEVSWNKF